jgi:hypothetical protein
MMIEAASWRPLSFQTKLAMSLIGPELTSRDVRHPVAIRGKADATRTSNFVG